MTALAAVDRLVGDLDLRTMQRFDQVDLDRDRHVPARGRPPGASTERAASEERVEQVADRSESIEVGRIPPEPSPS